MSFFERQERARRTSRYLVVAFMLSFAAVVLATTALTAFVLRPFTSGAAPLQASASLAEWAASNAGLLGVVALGTLGLMTLASLYRTASLSGGGGKVARLLGGTEVSPDTTDFLRKRLLNVVEEMTIASGLPMPDVYILEQEAGINAFAAGITPTDAAIAVTRGAVERLDRAELQGVIGHEISHILNGDIRLNQHLIGLSFGILVLSLIGRWLLRAARFGRRGRSSGGAALALVLGAGFSAIGSAGLLLSRLIKAAVSRERERLADASAVQFTRDPSGLAAALKKIAGYGGRLDAVESEEVAHMLFENRGRMFRGWLATHPPLLERILALEPSFDPDSLARVERAHGREAHRAGEALPFAEAVPADAAHGGTLGRSVMPADGATPLGALKAAPRGALDASADASPLERAGEIGSPAIGAELREALPAEVYDAAHSRDSSMLLVLALALAPDERVLRAQRAILDAQLGVRRAARCEALRVALERLDPALRIPLLELALPALRQRPAEQLEYLFELAGKLSQCGGTPRLFDHLLLSMLAAQVEAIPRRGPAARTPPKLSARAACAALLEVIAGFGHEDPGSARAAYRAGAARVGKLPEPADDLEAMRDPARLRHALPRLSRLGPRDKRRVLDATLAVIRHDKRIGIDELELLRAVAIALGCPLPWGAGLPADPASRMPSAAVAGQRS